MVTVLSSLYYPKASNTRVLEQKTPNVFTLNEYSKVYHKRFNKHFQTTSFEGIYTRVSVKKRPYIFVRFHAFDTNLRRRTQHWIDNNAVTLSQQNSREER